MNESNDFIKNDSNVDGEKTVVMRRDRKLGFGFRIGGQRPVYVDKVHENGSADRAGVKQSDKIMAINGIRCESFDHAQVVDLIINCPSSSVNLTLKRDQPTME